MQIVDRIIYTVSQINTYLKDIVDSDPSLQYITVKGEISNFTNHLKTGHFYFTLKDASCSIKAVMFRQHAQAVRFRPENGLSVLVTGCIRIFQRDGAVQLYCEQLQPDGIGALSLAFEQLKNQLAKEGLFDPERKKALPHYPHRIGIVTSKTGAALQDILTILERRYPVATVVLFPALVQGEMAAQSICDGIAAANLHNNIDVLIVGRGGGSIEDLWCFNEEIVARAIYACTIPVISAVGHEIDFTIADLVADHRAPTPSAAAELCAPDIRHIRQYVDTMELRLNELVAGYVKQAEENLALRRVRLALCSPAQTIQQGQERINQLAGRLELVLEHVLHRKQSDFLQKLDLLEALSPLKVLLRGYSLTYRQNKVVSSIQQIQQGDTIRTLMGDGSVQSVVSQITPQQVD